MEDIKEKTLRSQIWLNLLSGKTLVINVDPDLFDWEYEKQEQFLSRQFDWISWVKKFE